MADNIPITPGSGLSVAAESIGAAYYQVVKIAIGASDTNSGDVSSANPMPVTVTNSTSVIGSVTVSGTVALSNTQVSISNLTVSVVTGSITVTNLGNTTVSVVGSVNITASGGWINATVGSGFWCNATVSGAASTTSVTVQSGSITVSNIGSVTASLLGGWVNATVSGVTSVTVQSGSITVTNLSNVTTSVLSGWMNITVSNIGNTTASQQGTWNVSLGANAWTNVWKYAALSTTDVTIWTPNSGSKAVITDLIVGALYAGTVTLSDGGVGTGSTIMIFPFGANGGASKTFRTPVTSLTANNLITAKGSVTGGYILLTGYEI